MDKPKRRYELELKLGADSLDEIKGTLNSLLYDLDRKAEDEPMEIVSGGYGSGYVLTVKVDTAITHDSWYEHLEAYLAEQKAEEAPARKRLRAV